MIKQILWKRLKILRGLLKTYLGHDVAPYDPNAWWDKSFYTKGISDRQTISVNRNIISAKYHYASVELIILRHFFNKNINVQGCSVFDIGSGAGHWIDFYKSIGVKRCVGIDISARSVEFLRKKYAKDNEVEIYHGLFWDFFEGNNETYNIINAIGVMFHVVDDAEWSKGLEAIANSLREGGHLVVGGHFGLINNVNVQFDANNLANKRLHSRMHWKKTLKSLGFQGIDIYYNRAYLYIKDTLPENNILIASK